MYIKLIEDDSRGKLFDCTVGKVYQVMGIDVDGDYYFMDDVGERNYEYQDCYSTGVWQIVDSEGNAL